jgi:hypothetical protein
MLLAGSIIRYDDVTSLGSALFALGLICMLFKFLTGANLPGFGGKNNENEKGPGEKEGEKSLQIRHQMEN